MSIRILFTQGSNPLSGTDVVFDDATQTHQTNDDGIVEVDLAPGTHQAHLEYADTPLALNFEVTGDAGLQVIDVGAHLEEATAETSNLPADVPTVISQRYRVDALLGRGGMGVVVKAWDEVLERQVAIKFLNQELAESEEAREIFLKEARSLAKLRHERLVAVHDVAADDDQPIMVTEFVEGTDLAEALRRSGPLEPKRAIDVITRMAEGLGHMHEHGLIHRDIKPGNVISRPDGDLKLIDFGLARSLEHLTNKGTRIRGTPAYMAPEQVQGDGLGPATDVYQLGVTFFELLTGDVPFPEDPYGLAHVKEEVPRIEDYADDVPAPLAEFVEGCLAKDPEDRPADGHAVVRALDHLQLSGGSRRASVPNKDATDAMDADAMDADAMDVNAMDVEVTSGTEPDSQAAAAAPGQTNGETGSDSRSTLDGLPPNRTLRRVAVILLLGVAAAGGALAFWPDSDPASTPSDDAPASSDQTKTAVANKPTAPAEDGTEKAEDEGAETADPATGADRAAVAGRSDAGADGTRAARADAGGEAAARNTASEDGDGKTETNSGSKSAGTPSEDSAVGAATPSGGARPSDDEAAGPGDTTPTDETGKTAQVGSTADGSEKNAPADEASADKTDDSAPSSNTGGEAESPLGSGSDSDSGGTTTTDDLPELPVDDKPSGAASEDSNSDDAPNEAKSGDGQTADETANETADESSDSPQNPDEAGAASDSDDSQKSQEDSDDNDSKDDPPETRFF